MNVIKFSLLAVLVPILISCNQNPLIEEDEGIQQIIEEALSNELRGYFIDFQSDEEFFEHFFNLGKIKNINRFASCYRERSPWMYPGIGDKMEDLPSETQFLLINSTYQYQTDGLALYNTDYQITVKPGQLGYDLVTFAPVINGLGVIGLTDKYNPGGAISYFYWQNDKELKVELLDGGTFTAYSQNIPKKVIIDSEEIDIDYIQEEKRLTIHIPTKEKSVELKIYL